MALEDGESTPADQKEIVMQGPLAEIYAKALDVVYAKPDTVTNEIVLGGDQSTETSAEQKQDGAEDAAATGGVQATDQTGSEIIAQETQANDALTAQAVAAQNAPREETPPAAVTIYGVTQSEVTDATVAEVTKQITDRKEGSEYVLILDATQPGPNGESSSAPTERVLDLNKALETVAVCLGAKVYASLESFKEANQIG
jgi:hypothetical protein